KFIHPLSTLLIMFWLSQHWFKGYVPLDLAVVLNILSAGCRDKLRGTIYSLRSIETKSSHCSGLKLRKVVMVIYIYTLDKSTVDIYFNASTLNSQMNTSFYQDMLNKQFSFTSSSMGWYTSVEILHYFKLGESGGAVLIPRHEVINIDKSSADKKLQCEVVCKLVLPTLARSTLNKAMIAKTKIFTYLKKQNKTLYPQIFFFTTLSQ
uniref:Uncharacterized protein n=1 Tax=Hippocampus comes TaxID=109280 RepID=A0A3Q2YF86_HIPCM